MTRAACLTLVFAFAAQCRSQPAQVTLCHAQSLTPLLEEAARLFESNHPPVRVHLRPAADLEVVEQLLQGGDCDLAATTDWRLLKRFLIPQRASEGYRFLGDEMVLAARPQFLAEGGSWLQNWPERLLAGAYTFGMADPRRHGAGYNAQLVWKLSEIDFNRSGLYRRFLRRLQRLPDEHLSSPLQLAQLVRQGELDLAFLYRSTALQQGLGMMRFPSEASLGEAARQPLYARVFFVVEAPEPPGRFEVEGAPIRHGLCRLNGSGQWAGPLLDFLLGPEVGEVARGKGYTRIPVEKFTARE